MSHRRALVLPLAVSAVALLVALGMPGAVGAAETGVGRSSSVEIDSVSTYRDRVEQTLEAVRDAEGDIARSGRARELADEVAGLLPANVRVATADGDAVVSDPDMATLVEALADAEGGEAREARDALEEHVVSLRDAVGREGEDPPSDAEALSVLLAARRGSTAPPDASSVLAEWIDGIVQRIVELLSLVPAGAAAGPVSTTAIIVMVVLAIPLVWVVVATVRGLRAAIASRERRRRQAPAEAVSVVDAAEGLPPDVVAYAERLAAERRYRGAVRALFGGAAQLLGRSGLIAHTRTRTNGELLAELDGPTPEIASALRPLSDDFEVAWYGHVDPGDAGYVRAREQYDRVASAVRQRVGGGGRA